MGGALLALFGGDIGSRALRMAMLVAGLTTITGVLALFLGGLLNELQVAVPAEFGLAFGLLPSNAPLCCSSLVAAAGLRWAYDIHARLMFSFTTGS
jgi:hypothetical protein